MTDPIPTGLTPEAAMQVAVLYLTAAKLDAKPEQRAALGRIDGPVETADDARRIIQEVKACMGSLWNLSPRWGLRLAAIAKAGMRGA